MLGQRRSEEEIAERGRIFDRLQRVYYFDGRGLPLLFANVSSLNVSASASARRMWKVADCSGNRVSGGGSCVATR